MQSSYLILCALLILRNKIFMWKCTMDLHNNKYANGLGNGLFPPALLLQLEDQLWPCLRWICLLEKRGKVLFLIWTPFTGWLDLVFPEIGFFELLTLYNCPEPCSTRSRPLERSKRSQSQCRKSQRMNRSGGRGRVKKYNDEWNFSLSDDLKCYQQPAVFIFGFQFRFRRQRQ